MLLRCWQLDARNNVSALSSVVGLFWLWLLAKWGGGWSDESWHFRQLSKAKARSSVRHFGSSVGDPWTWCGMPDMLRVLQWSMRSGATILVQAISVQTALFVRARLLLFGVVVCLAVHGTQRIWRTILRGPPVFRVGLPPSLPEARARVNQGSQTP